MEVDVIPFLDYIVGLLGVVITAAVGVVGKKLNDRYNLDIEASHRQALQDALHRSVDFATNRAHTLYKDLPPIQARGAVIGTAMQYAMEAVPDAMKKFGIDPSTTAGQKKLTEMIETRLSPYGFDIHDDELKEEDVKDEESASVVHPSPASSM
jgi:hypothetical protein